MKQQKIRQICLALLCLLFIALITNLSAQSLPNEIDYSKKSNILNPDTLKGDQKLLFDHFVKWTLKQVKEMKPDEIKKEFGKLGLYTKENDRFLKAYYFLRSDITYHKKSVENWESFKDLAPGYKKSKKKQD